MTMLTVRLGDQAFGVTSSNFADRISDDDDALLDLEDDFSSRRKSKKANAYIRLMANYPIVISAISLLLGCVSFFTLMKYPLPAFDDPTAGFEARGTSISGAHRTLKLMKNESYFTPNISLAMKTLNISPTYMQLIQHYVDILSGEEDRTFYKTRKPKIKVTTTTNTPRSSSTLKTTTIITSSTMHMTDSTTSTESPRSHTMPNIKDNNAKDRLKSTPSHLSPANPTSPSAMDTQQGYNPNQHKTSPNDQGSGLSGLLMNVFNTTNPSDVRQQLLNISHSKSVSDTLGKLGRLDKSGRLRDKLLNLSSSEHFMDQLNKLKDGTNGVTEMKILRRRKRNSAICYRIVRSSVKLVFEERNGGNLWTPEAMHSICEMEEKLILPSLPNPHVCTIISLPNLIARQRQKKCKDLNEADMQEVGKFIRQCSAYACLHGCPNPAKECLKYSGDPLSMAYYLMDINFFNGNFTDFKLKQSMTFYNFEVYRNISDFGKYYEETFSHVSLHNKHVKITGIYTEVDDKFELFNTYMKEDLKYFVLAGVFVLFILTVYLGSVALIIATLINVVLSLGVAYFFYTVVLGISFFPFMNVLAGIILIAVGADDVFIYYDTWQMVKKKNTENAPQEKIVARTFRHAAVSIFVTSLTTSGAFFANYISRIAAIRCFGLFAGLAILANFFFMVTWTPSVIVFVDQIWTMSKASTTFKLIRDALEPIKLLKILRNCFSRVTHLVFVIALPFTARRLWLPCIFILTGIGICGFVVVFVKPRLELPDSKEFPLFPSSHPMENYDQNLRDKFRWQLEQAKEREMTVYFIWGAYNEDNGNRLDPNDDGHLKVDPQFSLIAPDSQVWMKHFCNKLKVANFSDDRMANVTCLLDRIETTQQHICSKIRPNLDMLGDTKIPLCCAAQAFPYSAEAFQKCLPLLLHYAPDPIDTLGSVLFDKNNNITGFIVGIKTKQNPTTSYVKMNKLVSDMDLFLSNELATAPPGLKNGWYMGTTESFIFYDLQSAISHGTYSSIELSLAVACITMFFCTLNPIITIYSMITISFAIAVTIGCLVLLGWQLNIVESVTISLAVGLSIDFTIHFGVAYVLAPALRPKDRVEDAFVRVGPAVAMAALTTFVAGASVMPSRIKAYQELGLFLMIVMATSWVYANFFFQPLCAILGPKGCQIPLPWKGCKKQIHYENPATAEQLDIHSLSSVDSEDDDDVALILNG